MSSISRDFLKKHPAGCESGLNSSSTAAVQPPEPPPQHATAMIIYNGAKYACVSCIRGHRSSTCKHTARMLVKVRTRGRPSPIDIRDVIMVDVHSRVFSSSRDQQSTAEERESDTKGNGKAKSCCGCGDSTTTAATSAKGKDTCCSSRMEAQPIIYIRVKQEQKAVLVDGKLKIIVRSPPGSAGASGSPDHPAAVSYMTEKEFLKQHSALPISPPNAAENTQMGNASVTASLSARLSPPPHLPSIKQEEIRESQILSDMFNDNDNDNTAIANSPSNSTSKPSLDETLNGLFDDITLPADNTTCCHGADNDNSSLGVPTPNTTREDASTGPLDPQKLKVDIFTHKGIYLSSDCSCPDDNCECINCLIHRNEDELSQYIQQSGIPLTNVADSSGPSPMDIADCSGEGCQCSMVDCTCLSCVVHPTEIINFEKFYTKGLLNIVLRRKTIIKYKKKLIPSEYWWDHLTEVIPAMDEKQQESIDLYGWFEKLLEKHHSELLDAGSDWFLLNDLEGFYVI